MLFPVAIELGDDTHTYGVVVPDIPGCFSAGESYDEALRNAKEAIEFHLEGLVEDNAEIPAASHLQKYVKQEQYAGFVWAVVDIDINQYLGKAEKINVTLPSSLINRIDRYVSQHPEYKSRSGFLASTALEKLLEH